MFAMSFVSAFLSTITVAVSSLGGDGRPSRGMSSAAICSSEPGFECSCRALIGRPRANPGVVQLDRLRPKSRAAHRVGDVRTPFEWAVQQKKAAAAGAGEFAAERAVLACYLVGFINLR